MRKLTLKQRLLVLALAGPMLLTLFVVPFRNCAGEQAGSSRAAPAAAAPASP